MGASVYLTCVRSIQGDRAEANQGRTFLSVDVDLDETTLYDDSHLVGECEGFRWKLMQPRSSGLDLTANAPDSPFLSRLVRSWLSGEGVSSDGTGYGPPGSATAWGTRGCPLVPRSIRDQLQNVRLPEELERHFGTRLTFDQLDSEILGQLNMTRISDDARRDFRDLLYSQQLQHEDQVAIPAGIPLLWLERLPIMGRTQSAVRRAFEQMESGDFLIFPMSESRFLEIRSVGMMGLIDLACVLESAERGTDTSGALLEMTKHPPMCY